MGMSTSRLGRGFTLGLSTTSTAFPQAESALTGQTQSLPKPLKLHENNAIIEVRSPRTESRLRASNGCPELG